VKGFGKFLNHHEIIDNLFAILDLQLKYTAAFGQVNNISRGRHWLWLIYNAWFKNIEKDTLVIGM